MKQRARDALIKPQYSVFDEYKDEGCSQAIAKSTIFENVTLVVIVLNALWMAVDTDYNPAALIIEAPVEFFVVENCFCAYFFVEISIRFLAFRIKTRALRDVWFVFDSCLVFLMVVETWILSIIALASGMQSGTFIG